MYHDHSEGLGRLGAYGSMGAEDCPPGYYRLKVLGVDTKQCLPTGSTLAKEQGGSAAASIAKGIVKSPGTQEAALAATGSSIGDAIVNFYTNKPVLFWGGLAVVAAGVIYGLPKVAKGVIGTVRGG